MDQIGRAVLVLGVVFVVCGAVLVYGDRIGIRLGRLPLDFRVERPDFSFYFPLGTSILISLVVSVVYLFLSRR